MASQNRLQEIAEQVMPLWIHKEILSHAEPEKESACVDQTQCFVSKRMNWRADYVKILTQALTFKTTADFESTLARLEQEVARARGQTGKNIARAMTERTSEEFSAAAEGIISPFSLISRAASLREIILVRSCLYGEVKEPEALSMDPDTIIGLALTSAFSIMKDLGVLDEWNDLIEKKPRTLPALRHLQPS